MRTSTQLRSVGFMSVDLARTTLMHARVSQHSGPLQEASISAMPTVKEGMPPEDIMRSILLIN